MQSKNNKEELNRTKCRKASLSELVFSFSTAHRLRNDIELWEEIRAEVLHRAMGRDTHRGSLGRDTHRGSSGTPFIIGIIHK